METLAAEVVKLRAEIEAKDRTIEELRKGGGDRRALCVKEMAERAGVSTGQIYRLIRLETLPTWRMKTIGELGDIRCWSDEFDAAIASASAVRGRRVGKAKP